MREYTMEHINENWPDHAYRSCNDKNRENAGFNRCARCTALELRSLELFRHNIDEKLLNKRLRKGEVDE